MCNALLKTLLLHVANVRVQGQKLVSRRSVLPSIAARAWDREQSNQLPFASMPDRVIDGISQRGFSAASFQVDFDKTAVGKPHDIHFADTDLENVTLGMPGKTVILPTNGAKPASGKGGPRIMLNDGRQMPQVGLGTWKSQPGEVKIAVKAAVKAGYRHIDCAAIYKNEKEVGDALAEIFAEGSVTRSDLWITSKLWNDFHAAPEVPKALAQTLSDLQLEYLDLYLIHWPVTGCDGPELKPSLEETWGAMEALQVGGKVKSIGVSNWSAKKMAAMKTYAKVIPAVNQVELHPVWRQDALLQACADLGTHVTAYSPLGSPDSAPMINHDGASVMDSPVVKGVAETVGKTPAQVLIRWAVQRGTSVIPKSITPSRIEANFHVFDWELSDDQMAKLSSIEPQLRMLHGEFWCSKTGPYKTTSELWDE